MKKQFQIIKVFILFFVLLSISGCEKDLYEEAIIESNGSFKLNHKTFNQLKRNSSFIENYNGLINALHNQAQTSQSRLLYGVEVDTLLINEIITDKYTTYTFGVKENVYEEKSYKNLIMRIDNIGEVSATLLKYSVSDTKEIESIEKTDIIGELFHNEIEENLTSTTSRCVTISVVMEYPCTIGGPDDHNNGSDGYGCTVGGNNSYTETLYYTGCAYDGTDYTNPIFNLAYDYTSSNTGINPNSNSGVFIAPVTSNALKLYSSFSSVSVQRTLIDQMHTDSQAFLFSYLNSLSNYSQIAGSIKQAITSLSMSPRADWFLEQSPESQIAILQYQSQNNFSLQSTSFVNQCINQMMNNPELELDIDASSKSPAFIDLSSIKTNNTDTPIIKQRKEKFLCIYNKLMQSSKFKELFKDMFNDSTMPNVKFILEDLPGTQQGSTHMALNGDMSVLIKIDQEHLDTDNNMEIALTILHECIHAFLGIKSIDGSVGMNIPTLNNSSLQQLLNTTPYHGINDGGEGQHNFIYNYMIPTMTTVLAQVKDLLVDPQINTTLSNMSLSLQNGYSPWNWNTFYQNFCLSGLEGCTFFQNEIATLNPNGGMPTIVNLSKYQTFTTYNYTANNNLNNNCQ